MMFTLMKSNLKHIRATEHTSAAGSGGGHVVLVKQVKTEIGFK